MTLAAIEYTDAAQMLADYAERRRRFAPPPPLVVIAKPEPAPQPQKTAPVVTPRDENAIPAKNSRLHMFWTPREVATLRKMASEGKSARAIAIKVGRNAESVIHKARTMGVSVFMRPTSEFNNPLRGDAITSLYKVVVDQSGNSLHRVRCIVAVCSEQAGISAEAILGDSRNQIVVLARQQAMWLAAKETGLSYVSIGKIFNRDHTTVLHAVRRENARVGATVRHAKADAKKMARAGL